MKERKKRSWAFDRKWLTVALCVLMVMVTLGFASSTKSLFPDEIAKELGVSRSLVVIGESCRYMASAIVNIFFGWLVLKFGEKKLICAGFSALVASMLLYAFAENLWMIYLGGTLLGIGLSWTNTAMVGHIVDRLCSGNKGTVMGFVLASNGVGGAIAIQLVGGFIDPNVTGSYRRAYLLIAAVIAVTALIVLLLFREPKEEKAGCATPKKKRRGSDWSGIPLKDAVRKFYFWGILICIFASGLVLQGTHGIVAMHYKDVGIDYGQIKAMLSFSSLILAGAKFLAGFSYDRLGLRVTASVCILASIFSCFLLAFTTGNEYGTLLAIIYTVVSPFAMPLETVMIPIYATELFGKHSYSTILGLFASIKTIGYMMGGWVMNLCYDVLGSYYYALIGVGTAMLVVFALLQVVISMARKERRKRETILDTVNS